MNRLILLTAAVLCSICTAAHERGTAVNKTGNLNSIALYGDNGWGGVPESCKIQNRIGRESEESELIDMARTDDNPHIRTVAFAILLGKNNKSSVDILIKALPTHPGS